MQVCAKVTGAEELVNIASFQDQKGSKGSGEDIEHFLYGDCEFQQRKCYRYINPEKEELNKLDQKDVACLDLVGFWK